MCWSLTLPSASGVVGRAMLGDKVGAWASILLGKCRAGRHSQWDGYDQVLRVTNGHN